MKKLIQFAGISVTGLFLAISSQTFAQAPATSLAELLNNVEQDRVAQSAEHRDREQRFQQQANQQQSILDDTKARRRDSQYSVDADF